MTTFTFDGTSSSTIAGLVVRDVKRPLLGESRSVFVTIPGRDGTFQFEDKRGDRELVLRCAIAQASASTRRSDLRSVAGLIDKTGKRNLIIGDESDRYWLGQFVDWSAPEEVRGWAEFDLVFRCDPYAYATSASTQTLGPTSTEPYSTTFSVTTDADTPFVCEITPSGAALTNGFTLTVNGDALVYGTTVPDGTTCTVSSVANTVKLGSSLSMATVSGTFGELVNGTNSITFDRASGTASTTLVFSWRRRYA